MTSPFIDEAISLLELLRVYPTKWQIQQHLSQRFSTELAGLWAHYTEIKSRVGKRPVVVTPFDYDPGFERDYECPIDLYAIQFPFAKKSYLDFCQAKGIDPEEVKTVIQEFVEQQIASNRA